MVGPEIGMLELTADGQGLRIVPQPKDPSRPGVLSLKAGGNLVFVADTQMDRFIAYPPQEAFDHLHSDGKIAVHFRDMPDDMDRGFTSHEIISRRAPPWNRKSGGRT